MSDDEDDKPQKGQGGGKVTAASVQAKVEGEIRKSKLKALESKAKAKLEEIDAAAETIKKAQDVHAKKKEELKELFLENADLLDK